MTVDPNFLTENAPAEQEPFIHRWCRCGHREVTHWGDLHDDLDAFFTHGGNKVLKRSVTRSCRRDDCKCTEFRPKKRKNRIKFFLTGRG